MLDVRQAGLTADPMQALHRTVRYEVTISDDLRALVAGSRLRGPGAPRRNRSAVGAQTRRYKLRRDGLRPVIFEGLEVFRLSVHGPGQPHPLDDCTNGHATLSIYSASDVGCIAHWVLVPPPWLPARPVYRTTPTASAADIVDLLRGSVPDLGLMPEARSALRRVCDDLVSAVRQFLKPAA